MSEAVSVYEAAGGEETFRKLVDHFYAGVADDPLLRPLYPEDPTMFVSCFGFRDGFKVIRNKILAA